MIPLIDADMLVYEAAFGGENRETEEVYGFEYVAALVDKKIADICHAVGATSPPVLYLTGDDNFRFDIATVKPYKGTRKAEKPFHYYNIRAYLESLGAVMIHGMEADDALAIRQMEDYWMFFGSKDNAEQHSRVCKTVICTRDKDLRQVPGWHYGWEHGKQPEFELQFVVGVGDIELIVKPKTKEIKGTGLKFFYSQIITGDSTDNIPGLPRKGAVAAYDALSDATTEGECFAAVREAYKAVYDDDWEPRLLEQGQLLWMVRELKDGKPVMWEIPDE